MVSERSMTPDEEARFDRIDDRGDTNAFLARAAAMGEMIGTSPAEPAAALPATSNSPARRGRSYTPEVQPRDSDIDPHWKRTVDYLSPEQVATNSDWIAKLRAQQRDR